MSEISIDVRDLKDLVKEALAEIISESEEPFLEFDEFDEEEPDDIGLLEAADVFLITTDLVGVLNRHLANYDYSLNTCYAYRVLAGVIEELVDVGFLDDEDGGWEAVISEFFERADEFIDADVPIDLPVIDAGPEKIVSIFDAMVRYILAGDGEEDDITSLDVAGRIVRIKVLLVALRARGIIRREWPWVGKLIEDLNVLFRKYRPIQPPTGSIPGASYGGHA